MDIRMPVMDGLKATRRIRNSMKNRAEVPIIAMTAHAMNGVRAEFLAAGMNDFISKPFTIAQISKVISKIATAGRPKEMAGAEPPNGTSSMMGESSLSR